MRAHRNARGITLISFLILLLIFAFIAYTAMKLVPAYVEYFGVVKSMEQVKIEPGAATKSIDEIRRDLNVKFDLQYVDEQDVPPQAISLEHQNGASTLRIKYERRIPFIYNIDLLASFDKSVMLTNAGAN